MKDMDINKQINRRDALKRMGTLIAGAAIATTPLAAKVVTPKPARIKRLVFFFSATGNSLYVARQLGRPFHFQGRLFLHRRDLWCAQYHLS